MLDGTNPFGLGWTKLVWKSLPPANLIALVDDGFHKKDLNKRPGKYSEKHNREYKPYVMYDLDSVLLVL